MAFNIADLFERAVDAVPDRMALIVGDVQLTFAELDERANRIAHHLPSVGIGVGDHVGIYGQNWHEWIVAMFGCVQGPRRPDQHQLPLRRGRAASTSSTTPTSSAWCTTASTRRASPP